MTTCFTAKQMAFLDTIDYRFIDEANGLVSISFYDLIIDDNLKKLEDLNFIPSHGFTYPVIRKIIDDYNNHLLVNCKSIQFQNL